MEVSQAGIGRVPTTKAELFKLQSALDNAFVCLRRAQDIMDKLMEEAHNAN